MSSSSQRKIRVVLADDHSVVRKGTREYLQADPSIEVVGEASDGAEAVTLVARELPDIAILDIQMPSLNGLEATRVLKKDHPAVRVLILTAYDDDPYIFAGLKAGASGYLLKTASPGELIQAVHALMAGESALSPTVAKKLVQRASGAVQREELIESLSERELEVLRLAAKGMSNRQIGMALSISDRTVQGHLANIYGKLHVATRTEAVLFAVRQKWVSLE
jgi:DNA-binding NarL/FixJ family response regulator